MTMTNSNRHHVFNLVALVAIEPEASEIRDYHGSAKPARVAGTDLPGTGTRGYTALSCNG